VTPPAREPTTLSVGQRLLLGLAVAPACLSMALGTLASLVTDGTGGAATVTTVIEWVYVLFLLTLGGWTSSMAITGRGPELTG
jgi:hypothetical protein